MSSSTSVSSLAVRAGHASTSHAMIQGLTCHARGVDLLACDAKHLHARVRSRRTHDVHLRAEGERLLVTCSCAASTFGAPICQHAWAALLEADRRPCLDGLRTARKRLVVEAAERPAPDAAPAKAPAAKRAEAEKRARKPRRKRSP